MPDFTGAVHCHVISKRRQGCLELVGNIGGVGYTEAIQETPEDQGRFLAVHPLKVEACLTFSQSWRPLMFFLEDSKKSFKCSAAKVVSLQHQQQVTYSCCTLLNALLRSNNTIAVCCVLLLSGPCFNLNG